MRSGPLPVGSPLGEPALTHLTHKYTCFYTSCFISVVEAIAVSANPLRIKPDHTQCMFEHEAMFNSSRSAAITNETKIQSRTYFDSGEVFRCNRSASVSFNIFFQKSKPQVHFLLVGTVDNDGIETYTCTNQRSQVQKG